MPIIIGVSIALFFIIIIILGYRTERRNMKHGTLSEDILKTNYEEKTKNFKS